MHHAPEPFTDAPARAALRPAPRPRLRKLRGKGVLILGDHRQALAVARSLRAAGYRVIAGRHGPRSILERSRCVAEVWEHPSPADPGRWADALEAFCLTRGDVGVIFPVGAHEIDLLTPLAARLPVLIASVAAEILRVCRSKSALLALADRAGVPAGEWAVVFDTRTLLAALARIGYPAVLKPDRQDDGLGFKAVVLRSCGDAKGLAQSISFPATGFVVQRAAGGDRHNLYFAARSGSLIGLAQIRIVRTDRPDGTGLAVEGISVRPDPVLVEWTATLVKALDYTGAGCAQYMVDAAVPTASFLEINARLGANCAAVCACGLDLPRLFIETLMGSVPAPASAQVGRRYAWLEGDLRGVAACLRAGRVDRREAAVWLLRAAWAQLRADDQIEFSWRDPLPTLVTLGQMMRAPFRSAPGGR